MGICHIPNGNHGNSGNRGNYGNYSCKLLD